MARLFALFFWLLFSASTLGHAAETSQVGAVSSVQNALGSVAGWFGSASSSSELLPPDESFQLTVRARDANTLIATLTPAKDYYLYRSRIKFSVQDSPGIAIAGMALPAGEMKDDATFGQEEVYRHPIDAVISLQRSASAGNQTKLHSSYQGCNEPLGVCYPPIEKTFDIALPSLTGAAAQAVAAALPNTNLDTVRPAGITNAAADSDGIGRLFAQGSSWALVVAFFGFGLLLAFTPCMLPMIPILSGIIVGQSAQLSRRHAFVLSLIYVLGMAITYALAGVAAGFAGTLLSSYLQNPWVLGSFAALFVLLALSMFGFYELQIPAPIRNRLARAAGRSRGGRAIGVFLMGVLSAVIVGPCVAAPLAGALLYIGQTHDVVLGGVALFSLAIGMGVPLLAIGTAAGTLLPRAGAWMKSVQHFFGVTMLAVAIYLVSPVIPALIQMLLWASLLIVSAMYLHAIDPLPTGVPGHRRLWKGVGVIALVSGVALLVGALSGSRDPLQPLAGMRSAGAGAPVNTETLFQPVRNVTELDTQLQTARGRYVMLDYWAEWCVSCKEMERFTLSDPRVQARLKDVLLLRADVTANSADDRALLKRFALFGPPGIIFFDRQGEETGHRVIGFMDADAFIGRLNEVLM